MAADAARVRSLVEQMVARLDATKVGHLVAALRTASGAPVWVDQPEFLGQSVTKYTPTFAAAAAVYFADHPDSPYNRWLAANPAVLSAAEIARIRGLVTLMVERLDATKVGKLVAALRTPAGELVWKNPPSALGNAVTSFTSSFLTAAAVYFAEAADSPYSLWCAKNPSPQPSSAPLPPRILTESQRINALKAEMAEVVGFTASTSAWPATTPFSLPSQATESRARRMPALSAAAGRWSSWTLCCACSSCAGTRCSFSRSP